MGTARTTPRPTPEYNTVPGREGRAPDPGSPPARLDPESTERRRRRGSGGAKGAARGRPPARAQRPRVRGGSRVPSTGRRGRCPAIFPGPTRASLRRLKLKPHQAQDKIVAAVRPQARPSSRYRRQRLADNFGGSGGRGDPRAAAPRANPERRPHPRPRPRPPRALPLLGEAARRALTPRVAGKGGDRGPTHPPTRVAAAAQVGPGGRGLRSFRRSGARSARDPRLRPQARG